MKNPKDTQNPQRFGKGGILIHPGFRNGQELIGTV
jgi:hypothetical protein